MNCEQAQEIILTEHLDGCLTGSLKSPFEAHLDKCPDCRAFALVAAKTLLSPFANFPRERMPESVASMIMQRVRMKKCECEDTWVDGILEKIRQWYAPALPAAGWAMAVVICFMIAGVRFNMNGVEEAKQTERVLFLAEVEDFSPVKSAIAEEYGTSMETYFLEDKETS